MRSQLRALFALMSVATVLAHSESGPRRKTIGFGPVLPHAKFTTAPEAGLAAQSFTGSSDPFDIARAFLDTLVGSSPETSYTVREDSYTDDGTGITHVYAKQIIRGLEVADARININIKDGKVISYGDTFYRGEIAETSLHSPQVAYCQSFADQMQTRVSGATLRKQSSQMPMGLERTEDWDHSVLDHIHSSNCGLRQHQVRMNDVKLDDPRAAALMFMIAATPSSGLADDLTSRFGDYLSNIEVIPSHSLHGSGPSYTLTGVPDTVNPVQAHLAYAQVPNGDTVSLRLIWKLEVEMEDNWYEASVDAYQPSTIVAVVDWASDSSMAPVPTEPSTKGATYNVFPWGVNDPSEGERSIQEENFDSLASPIGWHSIPSQNVPTKPGYFKQGHIMVNHTTTAGNNVFAHENWEGLNGWLDNYRPDAGSTMVFNYSYEPTAEVGSSPMDVAQSYINATVTQLFYTTNMVHDLYYRYGFDEKSGNFQQHNFGRGGLENDAVIANAQDGSGFNNANFMTPPDGKNGRCRMYLWNTASPYRDGDLEAGIVIHELSHGLSTRLTGGPMDSGCLGWGESGGMGEGWGDFLATSIRSNEEYQDYAMGAWAANRRTGIRNYIYSTNMTINPSTYKTLDNPGYWGVHAIGEVWAEILWVTSQILIKKHGYSKTLYPPKPDVNGVVPDGDFYRPAQYDLNGKPTPSIPIHGNTLMFQLVIDGMKLQPCSPGFFEARDAIIQADQIRTNGENFCELWQGFASRGLGPDARVDGRTPWGGGFRTNDYSVPAKCAKY